MPAVVRTKPFLPIISPCSSAVFDQEMAMAGRLWWLLRYLGHDKVAVLDGGYAAWKEAGYEVTADVPTPQARAFTPHVRPDMLVDVQAVRERSRQTVLLDSRAPERYRGEVEPLDPKAGHIPGALSFFYKDNLASDMTMLPVEKLSERIADFANQDIIVYCGSGVTACSNLLALHAAGRTDVKLYTGRIPFHLTHGIKKASKTCSIACGKRWR